MLKRRGPLGTRSPHTHNEAAFGAALTQCAHRSGLSALLRSLQIAHSPSPQCSNAEVYSVHDHRARTEADHRLHRSHQVEHSPSPQCSNAEVYSVHDHRTRTMRQLLVLRSMRTQGAAAILALEGRSGKYPRTPLRRRTPTCPRYLLATRSIQTAAAETMGALEISSHCLRSSVRDTGKLTSHY